MKKCGWILALCIAVLLLGSFPVRTLAGALACDLMRIVGFVLLLIFLVLRAKKKV